MRRFCAIRITQILQKLLDFASVDWGQKMALKLMYITNNADVASIAQSVGVDRIFVDLEYIGKEKRQMGHNSVLSHHTIEDIRAVKQVMNKSELLVRVNPIQFQSERFARKEIK